MGLEVATYIADLVSTNPLTSDAVAQGDDHLRLLKTTLQATFPNFGNRFSRVISGATGYTVLSSDNTAVIDVPVASGATVTHTFSLPALSSITAGFYFSIISKGPSDHSIIVPTGGASIEGAANLTLLPKQAARVYYDGTTWKAARSPMFGETDSSLSLASTLSVSGAATLGSTLSVSGIAHFKTHVSVGGSLAVDDTTRFSGATMSISSSVHMHSGLSISGAVGINGLVSIAGAVTMGASLHIGTTLTVSGATRMVGALSVAGAVHMNTTLSVGGAVTLASTLTVSGAAMFNSAVTISGTCVLISGQLKFPATQNASADANTLDDYEEGTWTPSLSFATNGNFTVVFSTQSGTYTKIGRRVTVTINLVTSTFTHTTASGNLQITTLPFTPAGTYIGSGTFQGITKANYTQYGMRCATSTTTATLAAAGSGQAASSVTAADMPTGGTVILQFSTSFEV